MKINNPVIIPRNHKVEEALKEANNGNLNKINRLLDILKKPYSNQEISYEFRLPAPESKEKYQTFCGT